MTPVEQFLVWGTIAILSIACIVLIQLVKVQYKENGELWRENELLNKKAKFDKKLINELSEKEATFRAAITKFNNYMEELK